MCFLLAHLSQLVIVTAQTHNNVIGMAQHTRDPASDFASQFVRTNSGSWTILSFRPSDRVETQKAQAAHTHKVPALQIISLESIWLTQRKLKYYYSFCSFHLCKRRASFPPLPFLIHIKIHAQSKSRFFLSVKERDFSNTTYIEVDWVEQCRLPQVICKAKQYIDIIYTLILDITYP